MDSLKTILSEREKCKKAKKAVFHNLEYILLVWCIHIQRWISEPLETSTSAPSYQHRHHIYLYLSRTPAVFSPFIYNISSPSTPHDHLKNAYTTLLLQECVFSSYFHKCPGSFLVFFDPHWVFPYFPPNIKKICSWSIYHSMQTWLYDHFEGFHIPHISPENLSLPFFAFVRKFDNITPDIFSYCVSYIPRERESFEKNLDVGYVHKL